MHTFCCDITIEEFHQNLPIKLDSGVLNDSTKQSTASFNNVNDFISQGHCNNYHVENKQWLQ